MLVKLKITLNLPEFQITVTITVVYNADLKKMHLD